jgi:HlyD family secretion protein
MGLIEESQNSRKLNFFGKHKKIIVIALVVVLVGSGVYYFLSNRDSGETEVQQKDWTVKQDDIKISIEADGQVVAEDGVELSFSVSDDNLEVEDVFVKEGDTVVKGDKIATVKTETLELSAQSAYSSYASALADYNETIAGATEDEIADAKDKITSAEISLAQAKSSLEETEQSTAKSIRNAEQALKDANEKLEDNRDALSSEDVEDAYESLVDTIKATNIILDGILRDSDEILGVDDEFINDDYEDFLGVKNVSSMSAAVGSYKKARDNREDLDLDVLSLNSSSSYSKIDEVAELTQDTLELFEDHLYDMKVMLEASIVSTDLTQAKLDGFKSSITSNRSSINSRITTVRSAIESVDDAKDSLEDYVEDYEDAQIDLADAKADAERDIANAEDKITSAEISLEQAQRDYNDLIAPLTEAEQASARSKLTSASISLTKARNELEKATITSPIDGEVAMLNYKAGDIIIDNSSSDPVAVIINNDTLFIEVNIEEADISSLSVGQKVYATFDALDGLELEGEVSFISLTSETDNSGIVTYLVRIVISDTEGAKIREGMTAFVEFIVSETNNVLTIPVASVSNIDGSPSVLMASGEWRVVTTGFTDGKYVEVISGLEAGEEIIY